MPALTLARSSWLVLTLLASPLLEASLAVAYPSAPTPALPPLQRGQVYRRLQGAGGSEGLQAPTPGAIRVLGGGMLDDPDRVTRPLLIELMEDRGRQWVMLERQVTLRTWRQRHGLANIQTLQVLDGKPLPARGQLLFTMANGPVACSLNGTEEADLVAFRLVGDRDHQTPRFTDLRLAWRVNRQQLRLEPMDPAGLSCANPAEGQP
jgi:hypothetical protein